MKSLNQQQKQLIFDYSLGITSNEESAQVQELIFSNEDAAQLHNKLKAFFAPLDALGEDPCPDQLEEKTIARLKAAAHSSHLKLQQLISAEQIKNTPIKNPFLRNFGKIAAAAAVILFVIATYFPIAGHMRQQSWQTACNAQLQRIGSGLLSYRGDNKGQMPMVATAVGDPWWKVGQKPDSSVNQSNTRHIYLLVRNGYVKPAEFICPAAKKVSKKTIEKIQTAQLHDFPGRQFVNYSFMIRCSKPADMQSSGRCIVMSDMNPLFENMKEESEQFKLEVSDQLKKLNSTNHSGRGQNVLFEDGSAGFNCSRFVGENDDDIFTLQNTTLYQGNETPASHADAFVAP
jgi:hypothetical protein